MISLLSRPHNGIIEAYRKHDAELANKTWHENRTEERQIRLKVTWLHLILNKVSIFHKSTELLQKSSATKFRTISLCYKIKRERKIFKYLPKVHYIRHIDNRKYKSLYKMKVSGDFSRLWKNLFSCYYYHWS